MENELEKLKLRVAELEVENEKLKKNLESYTLKNKKYYEENKETHKQRVKEYKEKTNYYQNLSADKTEKLIEDYLFAEREPLRDEVLELIEGERPTILQRKKVGDRVLKRIIDFVETFINGMSGQ